MNKELYSKFFYFGNNLRKLHHKKLEQCAESCGLSKQEGFILLCFANHPKFANANNVVNSGIFSKATVSKAVFSLSQKGLLTVETDPNDRRYQIVKITDAAKPIIKKLRNCHQEVYDAICEGLTPAETAELIAIIDKLNGNLTGLNK